MKQHKLKTSQKIAIEKMTNGDIKLDHNVDIFSTLTMTEDGFINQIIDPPYTLTFKGDKLTTKQMVRT